MEDETEDKTGLPKLPLERWLIEPTEEDLMRTPYKVHITTDPMGRDRPRFK